MNIPAERIIGIYERHAGAWVDARLREGNLYERAWLDRFCGSIPQRSSVLDLGCGAGAPIAKYLSERGYSITGVDSSAAMVSMFQSDLPREHAFVADMRKLSLDQVFHGILAWDSFFHLTHDDQRRMFPIFRAHSAPRASLMFRADPHTVRLSDVLKESRFTMPASTLLSTRNCSMTRALI